MCNLPQTEDTAAEYNILKAFTLKDRKSVTSHLVFDNPMFIHPKNILSLSGIVFERELLQ